MRLDEAQAAAWLHQPALPKTTREAVSRLAAMAAECLEAVNDDHWLRVQSALEDLLVQALVAMNTLDMQADRAFTRGLSRLRTLGGGYAMHVYDDHITLESDGEARGGWPLYTEADYDNALQVASVLGCTVIHHDSRQLALFAKAATP